VIRGTTTIIAHVGDPIAPVKAPMIYNPYFERAGIDAVVVPMGVRAADYPDVLRALFRLTNIRGALVTMPHKVTTVSLLDACGPAERLAIWCMLETPRGILYAREIAAASPRLAALVLGTSDLTKDLQALPTHDRLPLITSLSMAVLAARAHQLAVLDGVHLDLSDDEGFAASCRQGRELGFDGKTLIHPKQIAAANAAFAPTPEEVEWSRRIIAAHREAAAAGKGVVLVEGRLIENLHVENARRVLALADEIERLSGEK